MTEADDEMIGYESAKMVAGTGKATSKDITERNTRRIGINLEGDIPDRRRIRTKVNHMPVRPALITFQKSIGFGASVAIDDVPAEILGEGEKSVRAFTFDTAYRIEHLLKVARERMANGETDIRLNFSDAV